jgi:hypothetical protein
LEDEPRSQHENGNTRRAIDIHEREQVDAGAFKTLVRAAVAQSLWRM